MILCLRSGKGPSHCRVLGRMSHCLEVLGPVQLLESCVPHMPKEINYPQYENETGFRLFVRFILFVLNLTSPCIS